MQNNLTTLANVVAWLGTSTPDDNISLTRLIAQASRVIYGYLDRASLFQRTCADTYDGPGRQRLILAEWPVLSVTTLTIGTQSIPAAASYGQTGYRLEKWDGLPPGRPQALDICGYAFCPGNNNVSVSYLTGYAIQNEAQTIPAAPYALNVAAPYGNWAVDQGVTYANATPFVKVASNPASGQYSVNINGVYSFNSADSGQSVLISYSFIPADIEQVCIELVAERYRYRDRIGQTSKSLGGQETVAFSITDMPPYLKMALQPYRRTILA